MTKTAQVLPFKPKRRPRPASTTPKYFGHDEVMLIRRTARDDADLARSRGRVTKVRVWMLIDLLTSTGLREAEAADLRIGDLHLANGEAMLDVMCGKGNRYRRVIIPDKLKAHLKKFIKWKAARGEPIGERDYLFMGQRGPLGRAGVAFAVRGLLKRLGLWQAGKNVHSLRHSYACELYRQRRDLRAVQTQLGHASPTTTAIYAQAVDLEEQVNEIW